MGKPDFEGTFKATITAHAVNETKESELPQLVLALDFVEFYNGEKWENYTSYNVSDTAYLVLVGKNGSDLLNCDQARKVFNWDGQSFAALDEMDIDGTTILVRTEENEWDGKTSFKVGWIDTEDANPDGPGLKKLDKKALKSLDVRFNRKAKSKPAKAKATAPKPTAKPPKKNGPPAKKSTTESGSSTRDEAWDYLMNQDIWLDKVDDGREMSEAVLVGLWSTAIAEMGDDEDQFTKEEWFVIREKIAKQIFKF